MKRYGTFSAATVLCTLLAPALLLAQTGGGAQKTEGVIDAAQKLIYSVNRTPEALNETSRAVEVITSEEIWRRNARTLPELLTEQLGVFVQQTNYGGGSPYIRGMVGKQILILVDGVRVNNATFRYGALQYLNTIDLGIVERVEIVRGVGTVLGSDALGGIINIITKKGPSGGASTPVSGTVSSRYSSADQGTTGRLELAGQTSKFRYLVGGTARRFDDLRGGEGVGVQAHTGYDEKAGNFNAEYFLSGNQTVSLSYQGLQQSDVPRTDRYTPKDNLEFLFSPQRLQLGTIRFQDLTQRSWAGGLHATAYWNRQDEGQNEIRVSAPTVERRMRDSDQLLGFNLEADRAFGESHRFIYGADVSTEKIHSTRSDVTLATSASKAQRGKYTDGATYRTAAVYLQDRFKLGQRLVPTIGLRFMNFWSGGSEQSQFGLLNLDGNRGALTGSAQLLFRATDQLHLVANAISGFRAPNLDDLAAYEVRPEGVEVPNTGVAPERIKMYEAGMKYGGKRIWGSAFVHYSHMTDLLVRSAGTYDGLSFFDTDGDGVKDPAEPNVLQKNNMGEATVYGTEVELRYQILPSLTIWGNHTYTIGNDDKEDVPLAKIPPAFGTVALRWTPPAAHDPWLKLTYQFANAQQRLNAADVSDPRIGPNGTDRFDVFALRGGAALVSQLPVTIAIENLTNEKYKYHGSGIYRPGRQLVLGVQYGF